MPHALREKWEERTEGPVVKKETKKPVVPEAPWGRLKDSLLFDKASIPENV